MKFWLWLGIAILLIGFVTGALGLGRIQAGIIGVVVALVAILVRFFWNILTTDFEKHQWH